MKKQRTLKIHSKFRSRRWDNTTVPEIRLEGRWLESLGFTQGGKVEVIPGEKRLVITFQSESDI